MFEIPVQAIATPTLEAQARAQGSVAQEVGTKFEAHLHENLMRYGLKDAHRAELAGAAGHDGQQLLELSRDLLTGQEDYLGIVVRELPCDCFFTFASPARKQSARDFTLAFDAGRVRETGARPLVIGVEAKLQHTNGSVDEKALLTALNVMAGRTPYGCVVLEGDGPKSQAYDTFHEICTNPEPFRQMLRSMTWGKPDHVEGPTHFYFAGSMPEFFHQLSAIRTAEAGGRTLPYVEYLASAGQPQWLDRRTGGTWLRPAPARKAMTEKSMAPINPTLALFEDEI